MRCAAVVIGVLGWACGQSGSRPAEPKVPAAPAPDPVASGGGCPESLPAPSPLPGVSEAQRTAEHWLGAAGDDVVLSRADIGDLNRAAGRDTAGTRDLTRRAWLEEAFRSLGAAGDPVPALLASFGIATDGGSFSVDLSAVESAKERTLLMEAAASKGVVLLISGDARHVYLGGKSDGPRALGLLASYPEPCPDGGVTERVVGKVVVHRIDPDRVDGLVAFGFSPGVELLGAARLRDPAPVLAVPRKCRDRPSAAVFFSPREPNDEQPLRVIVTVEEHPGPVELALFDPDGNRSVPAVVTLGGPPFTTVATLPRPKSGRYTAVLGDGQRIVACQRVRVRSRPRPLVTDGTGPVWEPEREITPAVENLYAAFVERLFDYPIEEDLTWPNLHTLLRDKDRNLLYNHLSLGEDETLELAPDCADLPYTLRAYFSWKMRLPFGFYDCTRGKEGKAPRCRLEGGASDNLMPRSALGTTDELSTFALFANKSVRSAVHSSSGRTLPGDDMSDYYPVPLTRSALKPGTLFADPYGHLLVLADWIPQGAGQNGILVGADAQPDGTVGRRRFWRGSFLFDPDTSASGAGFKAYRPRVVETAEDGTRRIVAATNEELAKSRKYVPYSTEQYQGSKDDFYDRMEALINPRPLDPMAVQVVLVEALEESVSRRVVSVQNGEAFMAQRNFAPIDMPEGSAIFLTTGPWEDYSTPSRDLRLLISIDTVVQFPDQVQRAPERFGISAGEVDAQVARIRERLDEELRARSLSYVRSDGSEHRLTLKDVVDRQVALEMAYNPNDCVEIRWGAPEGSDEYKTCRRHAPEEQRLRMERYRGWFQTRSRPAE